MQENFWSNKCVLVTGHTGFKGGWLSLWLQHLGSKVVGFSLAPPTSPSLFEKANIANDMISIVGDIRDLKHLKKIFNEYQFDVVIHLAAQSLVRYSYCNPIETYETNVIGSLNVLEAVRDTGGVRAVVMATTDKCYENKECIEPYVETDPMGGVDPYSSSKACAELLIASYRNSFFQLNQFSKHKTALASARAGNVIGGGDWAADRLIPDLIRGFQNRNKVNIRNPLAVRPWQHVLEPLNGYLLLAEKLFNHGCEYAEAWNFGPDESDSRAVENIADEMVLLWGEGASWMADKNMSSYHEAGLLKLDSSKAKQRLGWKTRWSLSRTLKNIVCWHKAEIEGRDLKTVCIDQINSFSRLNDMDANGD